MPNVLLFRAIYFYQNGDHDLRQTASNTSDVTHLDLEYILPLLKVGAILGFTILRYFTLYYTVSEYL